MRRAPAHRPTAPALLALTGSCPTSTPHGSCVCPVALGGGSLLCRRRVHLAPELPNQHHSLAPLLVGSPCPRLTEAPHPAWGSHGRPVSQGACPPVASLVPISTSSESEGGIGSGLQEVASLRRSTPSSSPWTAGCGEPDAAGPAVGTGVRGRWGRVRAGVGRREPRGPHPRHTRFSAAPLGRRRPRGPPGTDDADTVERASPQLGGGRWQPRVLLWKRGQGEPHPAPGPAAPRPRPQ